MRRSLAAVALCAAIASITGCSSGSGAGTGGSTATASPTVSAAAADNTKQVCADAKKVMEDSTAKMTTEIPKVIQSGGDALSTVKSWFTSWSTGLRTQAGRAVDPELKGALTDLADGIDEFNAGIKTVGDLSNASNLDTPKLKAAGEKLDKICGF